MLRRGLAHLADVDRPTIGGDIGNHVNFQGALYIVNDFDMDNNTTVWGPVITRSRDDRNSALIHAPPHADPVDGRHARRDADRDGGRSPCRGATPASDRRERRSRRLRPRARAGARELPQRRRRARARAAVDPASAVVVRDAAATEILWRDNVPVALVRSCSAGAAGTATRASRRRIRSSRRVTALLIVACVAVLGATAEAALAAGFCAVLVVALGHRRAAPDRPEPDRRARRRRRARRAHGDRPERSRGSSGRWSPPAGSSSSCSPTRKGSGWATSSSRSSSERCSAPRSRSRS